MSRKKTNEEFKAEVYELVKDEYLFKESYINAKTPIEVRHNECGHTYKVKPNNFISIRRNDGIKNSYCKENHIDLIRIPYWEYENIESILDEQGVLDIKGVIG